MNKTTIEWAETTWNPIRGCSMAKGSETGGCLRCYAAAIAARFSREETSPFHLFAHRTEHGPRWTNKVELIEEHLFDPLKWRKPTTCFVNSMSDLFHEVLTVDEIAHVFAVMLEADRHRYKILTKRASRMAEIVPQLEGRMRLAWETLKSEKPRRYIGQMPWPLPHVELGVSVENQPTANTRIPWLLLAPAATRFVSYEPALSGVDFTRIEHEHGGSGGTIYINALTGHCVSVGGSQRLPHLNQLIIGAESGAGARPFNEDWARETRDQCIGANVAFFYKQNAKNGKKIPTPLLDGRRWTQPPGGQLSASAFKTPV